MLKEKSNFISKAPEPASERFEFCLFGSKSTQSAYEYKRHDRMREYSEAWTHENIEHRVAHL